MNPPDPQWLYLSREIERVESLGPATERAEFAVPRLRSLLSASFRDRYDESTSGPTDAGFEMIEIDRLTDRLAEACALALSRYREQARGALDELRKAGHHRCDAVRTAADIAIHLALEEA